MYVLLVDQLRQHVLAVIAAGGEVDLEDALSDFDARLNDVPSVVDREKQALLVELGLSR